MLVAVAGILELGSALEELEDELVRLAAHGRQSRLAERRAAEGCGTAWLLPEVRWRSGRRKATKGEAPPPLALLPLTKPQARPDCDGRATLTRGAAASSPTARPRWARRARKGTTMQRCARHADGCAHAHRPRKTKAKRRPQARRRPRLLPAHTIAREARAPNRGAALPNRQRRPRSCSSPGAAPTTAPGTARLLRDTVQMRARVRLYALFAIQVLKTTPVFAQPFRIRRHAVVKASRFRHIPPPAPRSAARPVCMCVYVSVVNHQPLRLERPSLQNPPREPVAAIPQYPRECDNLFTVSYTASSANDPPGITPALPT